MANQLLAEHSTGPTGKHWLDNFIRQTLELTKHYTHHYNHQWALTKDPETLQAWFSCVEATRAKFRILDKDTYNFDKTRFMMGLVLSQLVVTGAYRHRKPKLVQPGNQTWTTVIQGVRAGGAAIPPYIIFMGKHHINMWYKD